MLREMIVYEQSSIGIAFVYMVMKWNYHDGVKEPDKCLSGEECNIGDDKDG